MFVLSCIGLLQNTINLPLKLRYEKCCVVLEKFEL